MFSLFQSSSVTLGLHRQFVLCHFDSTTEKFKSYLLILTVGGLTPVRHDYFITLNYFKIGYILCVLLTGLDKCSLTFKDEFVNFSMLKCPSIKQQC